MNEEIYLVTTTIDTGTSLKTKTIAYYSLIEATNAVDLLKPIQMVKSIQIDSLNKTTLEIKRIELAE